MEDNLRSQSGEKIPSTSPAGSARQGSHPGAYLVVPNPKLKLMEQVKEVMRLKHYSIRTERCYCDWIRNDLHPSSGRVERRRDRFRPMASFVSALSSIVANSLQVMPTFPPPPILIAYSGFSRYGWKHRLPTGPFRLGSPSVWSPP